MIEGGELQNRQIIIVVRQKASTKREFKSGEGSCNPDAIKIDVPD